jgi:hypothetical protein
VSKFPSATIVGSNSYDADGDASLLGASLGPVDGASDGAVVGASVGAAGDVVVVLHATAARLIARARGIASRVRRDMVVPRIDAARGRKGEGPTDASPMFTPTLRPAGLQECPVSGDQRLQERCRPLSPG